MVAVHVLTWAATGNDESDAPFTSATQNHVIDEGRLIDTQTINGELDVCIVCVYQRRLCWGWKAPKAERSEAAVSPSSWSGSWSAPPASCSPPAAGGGTSACPPLTDREETLIMTESSQRSSEWGGSAFQATKTIAQVQGEVEACSAAPSCSLTD